MAKIKDNPKVSVIMANYSKAKYLPESIESVLYQTYKNLELIIIDDCSDDNSEKIIRDYANKDNRIVPIFNNKNKDPAPSRNQGLKVASGDYIAILGSEDIALPHRVERQVDFLEKHSSIFLVERAVILMKMVKKLIEVYCVAKPSLLAKRPTIVYVSVKEYA